MPLLLLMVFVVVPIAELAVIVEVGRTIGTLPTIAILIVDSIVGSWLLKTQGRAAWRRFNQALREKRPPAAEVLDGVLVIFGGAFLITPGFITDVIGLLLLLPPTRALFRRRLVGYFTRRFLVGDGRAAGRPGRRGRTPSGAGSRPEEPVDVEGDAVDVDPPHLPR
ncbi:MAG: FxsA family protein [Actinomycetota bacterium]|nr:FxsA family protein [Actinomycetota bacterium]